MIIFQGQQIEEIYIPLKYKEKIIEHCLRKLDGYYIPGESQEQKAYGLLGGQLVGSTIDIQFVAPLYKNIRSAIVEKEYMDEILDKYAVQSETPLEKRAWVADPLEVKKIFDVIQEKKLFLIGSYHMHRVPWQEDKLREKPTQLDNFLAKDTDLFTFIIAVVNRNKPKIRAFYEGHPSKEIPIR